MDEPLVDDQGFPRNDIDVYQIRLTRNRLICKYKFIISKGLKKKKIFFE